MGGESQPAKIAKYLLKGYCLLNEYCPNGQNVPLVRSRDGTLICCCDDLTCPYKEEAAAGPQGGQPRPAAGVSKPMATASAAVPAARQAAPPIPSTKQADSASLDTAAGAESVGAQSIRIASGGMNADTGARENQLTLQGAEFQFSCVRLAARRNQQTQLLGGFFAVTVRIGMDGQLMEVGSFREAIGAECQRFANHVLLPEHALGVEISRAGGQVVVVCGDSSRFELPERDCLVLPVAGLSVEELVSLIWERVASTDNMAALRRAGARWMEVAIADGSHAEAAVRSSCG